MHKGTEEDQAQRNNRHRGTVGTGEQRNSRHRGTADIDCHVCYIEISKNRRKTTK